MCLTQARLNPLDWTAEHLKMNNMIRTGLAGALKPWYWNKVAMNWVRMRSRHSSDVQPGTFLPHRQTQNQGCHLLGVIEGGEAGLNTPAGNQEHRWDLWGWSGFRLRGGHHQRVKLKQQSGPTHNYDSPRLQRPSIHPSSGPSLQPRKGLESYPPSLWTSYHIRDSQSNN